MNKIILRSKQRKYKRNKEGRFSTTDLKGGIDPKSSLGQAKIKHKEYTSARIKALRAKQSGKDEELVKALEGKRDKLKTELSDMNTKLEKETGQRVLSSGKIKSANTPKATPKPTRPKATPAQADEVMKEVHESVLKVVNGSLAKGAVNSFEAQEAEAIYRNFKPGYNTRESEYGQDREKFIEHVTSGKMFDLVGPGLNLDVKELQASRAMTHKENDMPLPDLAKSSAKAKEAIDRVSNLDHNFDDVNTHTEAKNDMISAVLDVMADEAIHTAHGRKFKSTWKN